MRANSLSNQILRRIRAHGRGAVFTPKDFLDVGGRAAVDQALSRFARSGLLRRLTRGLYDYPRINPRLGPLSPSPDDVARALARQCGSTVLQVTGAQAANMLGLSTQVPAQSIYLTDGPSRRVRVGQRVIKLQHASPKNLPNTSTKKLLGRDSAAGTVVQALRFLGPDAAPQIVDTARRTLSPHDRRLLARQAYQAPDWMRPILNDIVEIEVSA